MTRGTVVAIFDCLNPDDSISKCVIKSCEFNGDMYVDSGGFGTEIVESLSKIKTAGEFVDFLINFKIKNFPKYDENLNDLIEIDHFNSRCLDDKNNEVLSFCVYDNNKKTGITSDFVYILNKSTEKILLHEIMSNNLTLECGEIAVWSSHWAYATEDEIENEIGIHHGVAEFVDGCVYYKM